MIKEKRKEISMGLAHTYHSKAQSFWELFRNSEGLTFLEKAGIIDDLEATEIAVNAIYMALENIIEE